MPTVTVPTLRGIILRDDDDKVIVQATARQVREFAPRPGQEVAVRPETPPVRVRRRRLEYASYQGTSNALYLYGSAIVDRSWVPTTLDAPEAEPEDDDPRRLSPVGRLRHDDYLYDREGRPVARITAVDVQVDSFDLGNLGDAVRSYYAGDPEITIHARGLPGVQLLG